MRAFIFRLALFILLLASLQQGQGEADRVVAKAGEENVALGKKVSLYPAANSPDCGDPEDVFQLTDGKFTEGRYWTQKSTVGWIFSHPRIVIDLGRIEPIDKVVVHSVGGGVAGVHFPGSIKVFVSDDGKSFHQVANLLSKDLTEDGVKWYRHAFSSEQLHTRGRYVMVALEANSTCIFSDEVEVFRGSFPASEVRFSTPALSGDAIVYAAYGVTPNSYRQGHFPVSPHVDWATPLSGGPIRSIMMNFSGGMRDVVEIAQRLDMNYVPVSHWSYYRPNPLPLLSQEQIESALPTSDVMVVGAFRWEVMPPNLLEKIKARIRDGMGLVCVVGDSDDWIDPVRDIFDGNVAGSGPKLLIPFHLIPGFQKPSGPLFKYSEYGSGRVVLLESSRFTRPTKTLLPRFQLADYVDGVNGPLEYYFAALNKLIIWAAKRNTDRIVDIQTAPGKVVVNVGKLESPSTLVLMTRDGCFRPSIVEKRTVQKAGGTMVFEVPFTRAGSNPVDLSLRDKDGRIVDFASSEFVVSGVAQITDITVKKTLFAENEPVGASVNLNGDLSGLTLHAALVDTDGREVAPSLLLPANATTVDIEMPYRNPLTLAARLILQLKREDEVLSQKFVRVWIDKAMPHDFTVMGWYALDNQPQANFSMKTIRSLGVDSYVSLPTIQRAENGAYGNVRFGPEDVAPIRPPARTNETLEREVCLSSSSMQAEVSAKLAALAKAVRPFGVTEWSIGDEENLGSKDYCISPDCLAAFRVYLKTQYHSLEQLNESWESHFSNWEEVKPSTLVEIKGRSAVGSWLDHRRFMESLFSDYHRLASDVITAHIPSARVGLSGTQEPNSFNGYDWWKLMKAADHISGYVGLQVALQRSFMEPGTFLTTFLGYDYADTNEQAARSKPWEVLFNGANGINYYTLISDTLNCPLIRPDLSMTKQGTWFFEEVAELKAGLGRLFMEARYENGGIAIHYSPASLHVATAVGLAGTFGKNREFLVNSMNLCRILSESHYQYDFIHEEQMARGDLLKYKVLFLPWSSAISPLEEKAIRQFVENGGTVIADSFCGLRDDHGKTRQAFVDVFGLRQTLAVPELKDRSLTMEDATLAGPQTLSVASGSRELMLTSGKALARIGEIPAVIVNQFGRGRAVFLNASFSNYALQFGGGVAGEVQIGTSASQDIRRPIRDFVKALLKDADVSEAIKVDSVANESSEVKISRFSLGEIRLVGLSRDITGGSVNREESLQCVLRWEVPMHVYRCRGTAYLGKLTSLEANVVRGRPEVFALLPYKVEGLELSGPSSLVPGEIGRFKVKLLGQGKIEAHVLHISVMGPDGRSRSAYAQNCVTEKGVTEFSIPFAYNDPVGQWTIMVRDVATGTTQTIVTVLEKQKQLAGN